MVRSIYGLTLAVVAILAFTSDSEACRRRRHCGSCGGCDGGAVYYRAGGTAYYGQPGGAYYGGGYYDGGYRGREMMYPAEESFERLPAGRIEGGFRDGREGRDDGIRRNDGQRDNQPRETLPRSNQPGQPQGTQPRSGQPGQPQGTSQNERPGQQPNPAP